MSAEVDKNLYLPTHAFVLDLLPSMDKGSGNYKWEGFVRKNCTSDYIILLAAQGSNRGPNDDSWSYMSIKTTHGVEGWELRQVGQSEITVILRELLLFSALGGVEIHDRKPIVSMKSQTVAHLPLNSTTEERRLIKSSDIDFRNATMIRSNPLYERVDEMVESFTDWAGAILEATK